MRAQSAGLFSKQARKWPISIDIRLENAENTDFFGRRLVRRFPKVRDEAVNRVTTMGN